MARMKRNIGDQVSGRIGNVVFYSLNGVNYLRAAPNRKKDSKSPQKLLHRQHFADASYLWSQLKKTNVIPIWNLTAERVNGYLIL